MIKKILFLLIFLSFLPLASADVLCVKKKAGVKNNKAKLGSAFTVAASVCPSGYKLIVNTTSFTGATGSNGTNGTNGTNGADGSLRIYGNGSAGAKNVTSSETLADANTQYSSFTLAAGQTLNVSSGTIIRSSGSCNIDGTIQVDYGALGGRLEGALSATDNHHLAFRAPQAGQALSVAQSPEVNLGGAYVIFGGIGATGVTSEFSARQILKPGIIGGGAGASSYRQDGNRGGGSFVLLCKEAINISGTGSILANAEGDANNGGGGAGGVIILASPVSIISLGLMEAKGGVGGNSTANAGPSGGGGGGIIHILAPSAVIGSTDVTGGSGGTNGTAITGTLKSGGAGGGACGGGGGNGSDVGIAPTYTITNGVDGDSGYALTTLADPTSLF